ncbi:hypothetical protein NDU88_003578 [Pleurodeles waltl]|uniref:Uncharacterized protein n=1 Tax=Pleurodeles waltl TaxID=8319 RepID=A0AAV7NL17_PLEWA|nr:hypothetical protein NDU88_003578 [Pleurodeles waltl]
MILLPGIRVNRSSLPLADPGVFKEDTSKAEGSVLKLWLKDQNQFKFATCEQDGTAFGEEELREHAVLMSNGRDN